MILPQIYALYFKECGRIQIKKAEFSCQIYKKSIGGVKFPFIPSTELRHFLNPVLHFFFHFCPV